MKLKKINEGLKESLIANGLTEPNGMQRNFSTKSGADCIIVHHQLAVKQQLSSLM
jgi:hypothetical protein